MKKIPFSRLLLYILLSALLPVFFVVADFFYQKNYLDSQKTYVDGLYQTLLLEGQNQEINEIVYDYYRDANNLYIEEELETLTFLNSEKEKVKQQLQLEIFSGNEVLQKRLGFISGKQNRLVFGEGAVTSYPRFKETMLALSRPVEVDADDLKKILAKIENLQIDPYKTVKKAPQFIITDFKLERKQQEGQEEVFKLEMKLLKRDYFKPKFNGGVANK